MAKEPRSKKRVSGKLLVAVNVLIIIGLGVFGGYYFKKYQNLKNNPPSADQVQKEESAKIIGKVSKLYGSLPTNEEPTIAKVEDKEKLKDQPFFAKAEKDDITLIYTSSKLAILYRPSTNQIINVSSVTIQSNQPKVRVIGEEAARSSVEKTLKEKFASDVVVSGTGDAKSTHSGITVVDLTGKQAEAAQKIAAGIGGKVGDVPQGEDKPADVDILVIAGE